MSTIETASPAAPPSAALPFEFRGAAPEYFGIWIVNLLLTIVTFGIWSAWAKVRRKRYFLGSTRLAGDAFEYHARPIQILKGRLLVFVVFAVFSAVVNIYPLYGTIIYIPILFAMPWVVNRSLRFNARVTSWRNVRFDFVGTYGGAFLAFVVMPFVGAISAGLLWPLASRVSSTYLARNHRFGSAPIAACPRVRPYYFAALQAVGLFVAVGAAAAGLVAAFAGIAVAQEETKEVGLDDWLTWFLLIVILTGIYGVAPFYAAKARNIIVNAAVLGDGNRFQSTLSGFRYSWIAISNLFATIASVGLLRPWAAVRLYRYQCACLAVLPDGELDAFVDATRQAGAAFGAEYAEMADIDIGL